MPPKPRAVPPKGKGSGKGKAASGQDGKKLAAQRAAQAAEEEKKKAIRKRTAALLEKEVTEDMDEDEGEDEDEDLPPPRKKSRASKGRRQKAKLYSSEEEGNSDEAEHVLDTVKDLLDFNNDITMQDEANSNQSSDEDEDMVEDDTGRKKGVGRLLDDEEMSDDEEVMVGKEPPKLSASTSKASRSSSTSKVTLSLFVTPRTKRIAVLSNRCMRRHGALFDPFPPLQDKESIAWEVMVNGCKSNDQLVERLTQLAEKDLDMKILVMNYTWQGMGSMRAELILKARQGVPTWYGLSDLEGGSEEVSIACKWLLKDTRFVYSDINLKEKTFDRNKPWMHKALVYLIMEQFWSVKGDAIKMGKQNNLYLQFPDPLLALCATAIQCALRGFSISGKLKGLGSVMAFTDEFYRDEYTAYRTLLTEFQTDMPTFYKLIKMDMKDALIKLSSDASTMLKKTSSMKIDKVAVEDAAKKMLAEREAAHGFANSDD